jgi:P4 family phage/plasmid primase-like protien
MSCLRKLAAGASQGEHAADMASPRGATMTTDVAPVDLARVTEQLKAAGLAEVVGPIPWEGCPGSHMWKISRCAFNESHLGSAAVIQFPSGVMHYTCFHDSCGENKWRELVALHPDLSVLSRRKGKVKKNKAATPPTKGLAGLESLSEDGVARLLEEELEDELRYSPLLEKWLHWDGKRWVEDRLLHVEKKLDEQIRDVIEAAQVHIETDGVSAFINKCRTARFRNDVLRLARSKMVFDVGLLDTNPWLLNVQNGVVDLRSGELLPHSPSFAIGKLAKFSYDPEASAPRFLQFIEEVTCGDEETARSLQTALGYALTGSTKSQVLFILLGEGSNGKSTLLELQRELMGDYSQVAASDLITDRNPTQHPTNLASLEGARFVIVSEIPMNARLDTAKVKSLTGGDTISVRLMYQDFHPMTVVFKLFIAANHLPRITDNSEGMWRRVVIVEFRAEFKGKTCDPDLKEKLLQEAPGILNWLLEGVRMWVRDGVTQSEASLATRDSYREGEDLVGRFIQECLREDRGQNLPSGMAYKAFLDWVHERREQGMNQNTFGRELTKHALHRKKIGGQSFLLDHSLKASAVIITNIQVDGDDEESGKVVPLKRAVGDGVSLSKQQTIEPGGVVVDVEWGDPSLMVEVQETPREQSSTPGDFCCPNSLTSLDDEFEERINADIQRALANDNS